MVVDFYPEGLLQVRYLEIKLFVPLWIKISIDGVATVTECFTLELHVRITSAWGWEGQVATVNA